MKEPIVVSPPSDAAERPHAKHSSSQLGSLAGCPGYRGRSGGRVHWITQQGQRGHSALETETDDGLDSSYEQRLVQLCRDYLARLPAATVILKEYQLKTIEGRWGYVDEARFRDNGQQPILVEGMPWKDVANVATEADLVDFKFVKVKEVTDAEKNLQGKDYVVGLFDEFPNLQTVHVHFLMPRFQSVTTATFTRDQVPQLKLEILAILRQAKRADAKKAPAKLFRPSYENCRFCTRAACPALYKVALKVAEPYATTPLPPVPTEIHASQESDPKVLGALKAIASVLEPWAQAVNHHCFTKAIDEHIVPEGYAIDYQRGKRKVLNPFAVFDVATTKFGLEMAEVIDAATISLTKLEEQIRDKTPAGGRGKPGKETAVNAFRDALRDREAVDREGDRPYLKRISDTTSGSQQ